MKENEKGTGNRNESGEESVNEKGERDIEWEGEREREWEREWKRYSEEELNIRRKLKVKNSETANAFPITPFLTSLLPDGECLTVNP